MQTRERTRGGRPRRAHTHVGFAEGHVYNAADYDEGVKRVPGVTKIPLDRAGRGADVDEHVGTTTPHGSHGDVAEAPPYPWQPGGVGGPKGGRGDRPLAGRDTGWGWGAPACVREGAHPCTHTHARTHAGRTHTQAERTHAHKHTRACAVQTQGPRPSSLAGQRAL